MAFAHPEFLVSTDWLAEHLSDNDVRVFETTVFLHPRDGGGRRVESGRSDMSWDTSPERASSTFRPIFPTTTNPGAS